MKIALITDDGKSISQHFGRAPYYLVVTLEDGKEVNRELRPKQGHNQFQQAGEHAEHSAGQVHGRDNDSHEKHISMTDTIQDCAALICGGMGYGAYESMRRLNIQPLVTDLRDIEEAIRAYAAGQLIDHTEKLH
jgi:predicted Fe-Mo cluster-binding NifX family protein